MNMLQRFNAWLVGSPKPVQVKEVVKPTPPKPKPEPKIIDIKVWVDLDISHFGRVVKFVCDGYIIPNIESPYDARMYLRNWLVARRIGDGFNHEATDFLGACIDTKTTSSMRYCGYIIKVTIVNNPQTESGKL